MARDNKEKLRIGREMFEAYINFRGERLYFAPILRKNGLVISTALQYMREYKKFDSPFKYDESIPKPTNEELTIFEDVVKSTRYANSDGKNPSFVLIDQLLDVYEEGKTNHFAFEDFAITVDQNKLRRDKDRYIKTFINSSKKELIAAAYDQCELVRSKYSNQNFGVRPEYNSNTIARDKFLEEGPNVARETFIEYFDSNEIYMEPLFIKKGYTKIMAKKHMEFMMNGTDADRVLYSKYLLVQSERINHIVSLIRFVVRHIKDENRTHSYNMIDFYKDSNYDLGKLYELTCALNAEASKEKSLYASRDNKLINTFEFQTIANFYNAYISSDRFLSDIEIEDQYITYNGFTMGDEDRARVISYLTSNSIPITNGTMVDGFKMLIDGTLKLVNSPVLNKM